MHEMNVNLNQLSNDLLLDKTHKLVKEERRITTAILHHLRVIESRRLFALRGYSSLFEFCVKELKYAESSAHRRISAMRLLREIPDIEVAMDSGSLNITTITQVQSFAIHACLNTEEKKEALKAVEGKSKLETEKTLNKLLVEKLGPEKAEKVLAISLQRQTTKPIIPGFNEVRFVSDDELSTLLNRVKTIHHHKLQNPDSIPELLKLMANQVLDKSDPERINKRIEDKKQKGSVSLVEVKAAKEVKETEERKKENSPELTRVAPTTQTQQPIPTAKTTRYIPAAIRRHVFISANNRCTYIDSKTKRRCEETRGLQLDHIQSYAFGGSNTIENLRIYCKAHNLLHAVQVYGEKKMLSFNRKL